MGSSSLSVLIFSFSLEITVRKARKATEAISVGEKNHANNNLAFKDNEVDSSPVSPVIPRKC